MRYALTLAVASLQLVLAAAAGAQVADSSAALSQNLLDIWNRTYTEDELQGASDSNPYEGDDGGDAWSQAYDGGTAPGSFTTPSGRSLTPNLDRLLQRSGNPVSKSAGAKSPAPTDDHRGGHGRHGHHGGHGGRDGGGDCPPGGGGQTPPEPVPEPGTLLLLGAAASAAAAARARRRNRQGRMQ